MNLLYVQYLQELFFFLVVYLINYSIIIYNYGRNIIRFFAISRLMGFLISSDSGNSMKYQFLLKKFIKIIFNLITIF